MESKFEYPKIIFTSIGNFISRRKGSDHHSAIISYLNDSNLNLPRFVIFPNYSGLLTAIKGNVSKNNYSRKYQHKVSESEITKEFSRFEMFTDSPEYNKAIINTKIFPSLLKIDNMKKEFSATLICDGTEIFLATDGWVYNTDRLAKLIELFFLIRQELIKLKR